MKHIKTGRGVRTLAVAAGIICPLLSAADATDLLMLRRAVGVVHFCDTTEHGHAVRRPSIHYTRDTGFGWGHTPEPDEISPTWSEGDTATILCAPHGKTSFVASPRLWFYPVTGLVLGTSLLLVVRFVLYCGTRAHSGAGTPMYAG